MKQTTNARSTTMFSPDPYAQLLREAQPHETDDERLLLGLLDSGVDHRYISHLLNQGASPDAVNTVGWNALHVAAKNHAHLIPALVTASNLNFFGSGTYKATPLCWQQQVEMG
jgi:ankyrin repeat protein